MLSLPPADGYGVGGQQQRRHHGHRHPGFRGGHRRRRGCQCRGARPMPRSSRPRRTRPQVSGDLGGPATVSVPAGTAGADGAGGDRAGQGHRCAGRSWARCWCSTPRSPGPARTPGTTWTERRLGRLAWPAGAAGGHRWAVRGTGRGAAGQPGAGADPRSERLLDRPVAAGDRRGGGRAGADHGHAGDQPSGGARAVGTECGDRRGDPESYGARPADWPAGDAPWSAAPHLPGAQAAQWKHGTIR